MAKSTPTSPTQRLEAILLFCVGLLILGVALFYDPIGTAPDTGVIELAKVQAKWLLGLFGASFIIAAIFLIVKGLRSK